MVIQVNLEVMLDVVAVVVAEVDLMPPMVVTVEVALAVLAIFQEMLVVDRTTQVGDIPEAEAVVLAALVLTIVATMLVLAVLVVFRVLWAHLLVHLARLVLLQMMAQEVRGVFMVAVEAAVLLFHQIQVSVEMVAPVLTMVLVAAAVDMVRVEGMEELEVKVVMVQVFMYFLHTLLTQDVQEDRVVEEEVAAELSRTLPAQAAQVEPVNPRLLQMEMGAVEQLEMAQMVLLILMVVQEVQVVTAAEQLDFV